MLPTKHRNPLSTSRDQIQPTIRLHQLWGVKPQYPPLNLGLLTAGYNPDTQTMLSFLTAHAIEPNIASMLPNTLGIKSFLTVEAIRLAGDQDRQAGDWFLPNSRYNPPYLNRTSRHYTNKQRRESHHAKTPSLGFHCWDEIQTDLQGFDPTIQAGHAMQTYHQGILPSHQGLWVYPSISFLPCIDSREYPSSDVYF
jgi:hypothetical protein